MSAVPPEADINSRVWTDGAYGVFRLGGLGFTLTGRPFGAELHRSAPNNFRLQLVQRWQARHRPQFRGISPYSQSSCVRAEAAPRAGCPSGGRSRWRVGRQIVLLT